MYGFGWPRYQGTHSALAVGLYPVPLQWVCIQCPCRGFVWCMYRGLTFQKFDRCSLSKPPLTTSALGGLGVRRRRGGACSRAMNGTNSRGMLPMTTLWGL
jgi:hypothetical protein